MNVRAMERTIRKSICEKSGVRITELLAYVATGQRDDEDRCDDRVDLKELIKYGVDGAGRAFEPGCSIDVYVYGWTNTMFGRTDELVENLELRFDSDMQIIAVLTTGELIAEREQQRVY